MSLTRLRAVCAVAEHCAPPRPCAPLLFWRCLLVPGPDDAYAVDARHHGLPLPGSHAFLSARSRLSARGTRAAAMADVSNRRSGLTNCLASRGMASNANGFGRGRFEGQTAQRTRAYGRKASHSGHAHRLGGAVLARARVERNAQGRVVTGLWLGRLASKALMSASWRSVRSMSSRPSSRR